VSARARKPAATEVPCNGCTLCCQREILPLHPEHGDKVSDYQVQRMAGRWVLAHKPNGDCIYLDRDKGCTIHNRRPAICREFDCRAMVRAIAARPYGLMARAQRMAGTDVCDRGRQLIRLEAEYEAMMPDDLKSGGE
jgi:hypothetical protein